jgi:hypothetical protein
VPSGTSKGGEFTFKGTGTTSIAPDVVPIDPNRRTMVGREEEVRFSANAAAERYGFDTSKINITSEPRMFKLNDQEHEYAGSANLIDGTITLYLHGITPGQTIPITIHEIMHQKFQAVLNDDPSRLLCGTYDQQHHSPFVRVDQS